MLLSLQHRFIFIHIYKTAGTSVTHALRPYAREPLRIRLLELAGLRKPPLRGVPDHIGARELRKVVPREIFDTFYKFAFVRNPWDWQVSLFHYMRELRRHPQHEIVRAMSFEDYIHWRVTSDKHLQKDFIATDDGRLLVDFVGRFEALERDAATIFKRLGIHAALPHRNRSQHADYRSYYNEDTRALIAEHFRDDIEMFGYSF